MPLKQFHVVNVFSDNAFEGNPVAVVTDADDLDEKQMQSFAAWNGMPETVYLQSPRDQSSQYHARIFSPLAELAFAGHPSLGAAHIAMECGVAQAQDNVIGSLGFERGESATLWQHCKVGEVEMKLHLAENGQRRLYVRTPSPGKVVALSPAEAQVIRHSIGCRSEVAASRVSAGAHWIILRLDDIATLNALVPDMPAIKALSVTHQVGGITVTAPATPDSGATFEVRSFGPIIGVPEDAVCGGGNACVAALNSFLEGAASGPIFSSYHTVQGRFVGRAGTVHILGPVAAEQFWIGGATATIMRGQVNF